MGISELLKELQEQEEQSYYNEFTELQSEKNLYYSNSQSNNFFNSLVEEE